MKAFAYLRVSGKAQVEGDGFDRQLGAITTYCNQNGIELVEVFREEGVSGAKEMEDRPALLDLLDALESKGVKAVVIERLDRLARDLMIQENILSDMRKRGVTAISVAEPDLCSDDPSRVLMRHMFGAIAQYEKTILVQKLRGARNRMKTRNGHCEGRKPYGSTAAEKLTLEQICEWRATGATCKKIAEDLNATRFRTRSGRPWHPGTVSKILSRLETRSPAA